MHTHRSSVAALVVLVAACAGAQVYPVGDLNEDRRVDIRDLGVLAEQWLHESCLAPGCEADLDGTAGVNAADFAIFARNWRAEGGSLLISEFMASNGSQPPLSEGELLDRDGDSSDWIEIYNPTSRAIAPGGWHLTDDIDDLGKWEFPDGVVIEPGAFLVVFASGKDLTGAELHTNFRLDADGGYLALVEEDGTTVACEYDYPAQLTNLSYGVRQSSMTFVASGLYEDLKKSEGITVLDTFDKTVPAAEDMERRRQSLLVDLYITGTNALTEDGMLVNLDMIGNRIGALTFGPKNVILIIGRNKVVRDLEEAMARVKDIAAPANAMRLDKKSPCTKTASCHECKSPGRICNTWTITQKSFPKGRVKIILLNADSGL